MYEKPLEISGQRCGSNINKYLKINKLIICELDRIQ
jgi:hypothetical protein